MSAWQRLLYIDDKHSQKVQFLNYPFIFSVFVYGFGFVFFSSVKGVTIASLHSALINIHPYMPFVWGLFAIIAALFAMGMIVFRKTQFGSSAAMLGVLVWLFAFIAYIMSGFWLNALAIAATNLSYWVWLYLRVSWYKRQKRLGTLVDPS